MWTLSQVSLDTGRVVLLLKAKGLCYGTQKLELDSSQSGFVKGHRGVKQTTPEAVLTPETYKLPWKKSSIYLSKLTKNNCVMRWKIYITDYCSFKKNLKAGKSLFWELKMMIAGN